MMNWCFFLEIELFYLQVDQNSMFVYIFWLGIIYYVIVALKFYFRSNARAYASWFRFIAAPEPTTAASTPPTSCADFASLAASQGTNFLLLCVRAIDSFNGSKPTLFFFFVYTRKEVFAFSKTENLISKKVCTLYWKANMTDRVRHIAYSWLI